MLNVPFDVDQGDWGSRQTYGDDPGFSDGVKYLAIHWGGGTSQIPAESEDDRLRIWQAYHMDSKGFRDIAYNYAVGDSGHIYRLRGLNPGGHTSSSSDRTPEGASYNNASIGVVWIGGSSDEDGPSASALESMALLINALPTLIVKGHREIKEENGSYTACPGDEWMSWIAAAAWEDFLPPAFVEKETSNPAFQKHWDEARSLGMYSEYTQPGDVITAEKLAVFLSRIGLFKIVRWFQRYYPDVLG